ncbi:uncharacterized protein METZ01_LOCUS488358, partial [marine metagenome]
LLSGSASSLYSFDESVTGFGTMVFVGMVVGLAAWTRFAVWRESQWSNEPDSASAGRWSTRQKALAGVSLSGAVLAGALVAWPVIRDGITSGLDHRREMWRVGFRILSDHPIVGTGLETYYSYFSPLRSVEHAVGFEGVVSDNIHSVPLGMFTAGGVVLGVSYLALVLLIGFYGFRALWRTAGSQQMVVAAVLACWVAFQVQSTVSVDTPGLVFTQWVLGGILLTVGAGNGLRTVSFPWV